MVGQPGLEPGTSVLSGLRSNQLSYWPNGEEAAVCAANGRSCSRAALRASDGLPSDPTEYIFGPNTGQGARRQNSVRSGESVSKDDFNFHCDVRVRWSEGDAQEIVYNARYFDYIEVAQAEYFRNLGIALYDGESRRRFDTATVKATLEFKSPARIDDLLDVYTRVSRIGSASFTMESELYRECSNELLMRAELVYVNYDSDARASRLVPDDIRGAIEAMEGDVSS